MDIHHEHAKSHTVHKFRDHLRKIPAGTNPATITTTSIEDPTTGHITTEVFVAGVSVGTMTFARNGVDGEGNPGLVFVTTDGIPPRDPVTGRRPTRR